MIGIPIVTDCLFKSKACLQILHMILFQKLRVEMKMIYGITIQLKLPTYIFIKSTIETKHTPIVYKTIIDTFHKYKNEPFPQKYIDGMKKQNKLMFIIQILIPCLWRIIF